MFSGHLSLSKAERLLNAIIKDNSGLEDLSGEAVDPGVENDVPGDDLFCLSFLILHLLLFPYFCINGIHLVLKMYPSTR